MHSVNSLWSDNALAAAAVKTKFNYWHRILALRAHGSSIQPTVYISSESAGSMKILKQIDYMIHSNVQLETSSYDTRRPEKTPAGTKTQWAQKRKH